MNEEKKIQMVYEGLSEIEKENQNSKSSSKTDFIFFTKNLVNYRKPIPPDVSEDGTEVRCARCKNLMSLYDCKWTDLEFCPLCGQRWQKEGTRENRIVLG